jgi:short-subunit dehydrogenase
MSIVADFSKMTTIEEYERVIGTPLSHLDIGLLAINAGVGVCSPFVDQTNQQV